MLTNAPRGTKDILPDAVEAWTYVENVIRELCARYGYHEIRTPVFEHTELFQRGIGDGTDVVDKEMYTFTDRGERSLTLRPENTASAVRAYLQNKLYAGCKSSSTSARCSAMTARRRDVCASSTSSVWRQSVGRALPWMPRQFSSRMTSSRHSG